MVINNLQAWLLISTLVSLLQFQVTSLTTIAYIGNTTTLDCPLSKGYIPDWYGPPNMLYYYQGGTDQFNSVLGEKRYRLSVAAINGSLIVTNTSLNDAGVYKCVVRVIEYVNAVQVRTRPFEPSITTSVPVESNGIRGTEDQPMTITCTSRGGYPAPTVAWYSGNSTGQELARTNNRTAVGDTYTVTLRLKFTPLRKDDENQLACRSYYPVTPNALDSQETIVALYLYLKPRQPVVQQVASVASGETVSIECRTNGSRPAAIISWIYRGHAYTPAASATVDNTTHTFITLSVLRIPVTAEDNGQIAQCTVAHRAMSNTLTESTTLFIQYPPAVTVYIENATVLNTSTTITCSASGVPNTYTYSEWIHSWNGQIVAQLTNTPVLTLTGLSYEDSGVYICKATNGIGGYQQGSGTLLVNSYPVIIQPESAFGIAAEIGNTASVNVTFYSNSGNVSVKCYRRLDNREVGVIKLEGVDVFLPVFDHVVRTKGTRAAITIVASTVADYGEYDTILSNEIGNSKVVFRLTAGKSPDIPDELDIHVLSYQSVNVSWSVGFNGGLEQTFVIQISKDQTTWRELFVKGDQRSSGTRMFHVIQKLSADTLYSLRMFSKNAKGSSSLTQAVQVQTAIKTECTLTNTNNNVPAIIGTAFGGLMCGVLLSLFAQRLIIRLRSRPVGNQTHGNSASKEFVDETSVELQIQASGANTDGPPNVYESLGDTDQPSHMYSDIRPAASDTVPASSDRNDYINV